MENIEAANRGIIDIYSFLHLCVHHISQTFNIEAFLKVVKGSLKKKNNVVLVGFGTFKVKKMAARNGKNPRTGKTIKIAAKNVVRFKAGTDLAKKVK